MYLRDLEVKSSNCFVRKIIYSLRIDTGAWDVIGVIEYNSCSPLHGMTCYIPYERSIFYLSNHIKQEDNN